MDSIGHEKKKHGKGNLIKIVLGQHILYKKKLKNQKIKKVKKWGNY